MFCPRCGNHPASDRMNFCANCGLRLDGVVDLLARGGVPINPPIIPQINQPSPRTRGIRQGAKLSFFSLVLFVPVFAFCAANKDGAPLILPFTLFLAGVFWMLYYRLFGDEYAPPPAQTQVMNPAAPQYVYLPPSSGTPVYRAPVETPQQQSVVENTTRTLGSE